MQIMRSVVSRNCKGRRMVKLHARLGSKTALCAPTVRRTLSICSHPQTVPRASYGLVIMICHGRLFDYNKCRMLMI